MHYAVDKAHLSDQRSLLERLQNSSNSHAVTISNYILKLLASILRRWWRVKVLDVFLASGIVVLGLYVLARLLLEEGEIIHLRYPLIVFLSTVTSGLLLLFGMRPSLHSLANRADLVHGLQGRLRTSIEILGQNVAPSVVTTALLRDAATNCASVRIPSVVPLRLHVTQWAITATAVAICFSFLVTRLVHNEGPTSLTTQTQMTETAASARRLSELLIDDSSLASSSYAAAISMALEDLSGRMDSNGSPWPTALDELGSILEHLEKELASRSHPLNHAVSAALDSSMQRQPLSLVPASTGSIDPMDETPHQTQPPTVANEGSPGLLRQTTSDSIAESLEQIVSEFEARAQATTARGAPNLQPSEYELSYEEMDGRLLLDLHSDSNQLGEGQGMAPVEELFSAQAVGGAKNAGDLPGDAAGEGHQGNEIATETEGPAMNDAGLSGENVTLPWNVDRGGVHTRTELVPEGLPALVLAEEGQLNFAHVPSIGTSVVLTLESIPEAYKPAISTYFTPNAVGH